jgi:hypothetical protein
MKHYEYGLWSLIHNTSFYFLLTMGPNKVECLSLSKSGFDVLIKQPLGVGPCPQPFIFSLTYEWAQQVGGFVPVNPF